MPKQNFNSEIYDDMKKRKCGMIANEAAIRHRSAFNNKQNSYRLVSYKRPRNNKCKTIQIHVQIMNEKQICDTSTNDNENSTKC